MTGKKFCGILKAQSRKDWKNKKERKKKEMANKYNVTRTIEKTMVTVMTVNPTTAETGKKELLYDGIEKTDKVKILKYLRKHCESETCSIVAILDIRTDSKLYGMTEEEFIKYAVVLNPETRKPLD